MAQQGLSMRTVYTYMGMMIVCGSINTIANKMQQNSTALGKTYHHVWFIVFCMFLGEMLCGLWYIIWCWSEKRKQKNAPLLEAEVPKDANGVPLKEASPFLLAIPTLCDFMGSTIQIFGLTMMAGSVYQMFRGSLLFFTALFSVIFLKNKLYKHHLLGLAIVITGLVLVGASSKIYPTERPASCSSSGQTQESVWGIVLVICAQIFSASQYIIEEKFMKGYHCHPLRAVGFEGMWGSSIYIILIIIFSFIKCDPDSNLTSFVCCEDDSEVWRVENAIFALRQLGDNGILCFCAILYVFSISIFNFVGISVSKYASSASRSVVDTIRTIVVWGFFLMPFIDECHREHFIYLQLIGFFLLISGTVIFNEVVEIPFLGLNQNTKKRIKEREAAKKLKEQEEVHSAITKEDLTIHSSE